MKRPIAVMLVLLWAGIILSTYYVVQKPGLWTAFPGLIHTLWTLVAAVLLLVSAYGLGRRALAWLGADSLDELDRLLLGIGVGLGILGVLGLAFSAAQIARPPLFFLSLLGSTVFFFLSDLSKLRAGLRSFATHWNLAWSQYSVPTKLVLVLLFAFSFLLTLAPQFEAFDALLYHLTQPARVLQDGGLRLLNVPHFWFPDLTENVYLWALALGSERLAQVLHWTWAMLSALLLWRWAVRVWGIEIGRRALLLLAAIPSLPMLTSWAYADLALVFYALATLYAVTRYAPAGSLAWLRIAGVMAGLAMAVKYTSFTVPLAAGLLILFWNRRTPGRAIGYAAQFSLVALIVAAPWYLRNAIVMGNPFYPFAFDGQYWDSFRAAWYAAPGTGIGWDPLEILLLPLNILLGYRDQNFFDGRLGPLFLLLAPLACWILLTRARPDSERGRSLQTIGLFAALTFAAWTFGVINSRALWQARLLLPAVIPFALPSALGWEALATFDTPRFRLSFLANALVAAVIALTLFDNAMFMLQRNPLAVAAGAQSRDAYIARVNPAYAALMGVMEQLPAEARLYSLFEPRSYGLPRPTQPDPINDNFFHDLYLYRAPSAILERWKAEGYTHILVYERGMKFLLEEDPNPTISAGRPALEQTLRRLELVAQTPDRVYSIYRIP